MDKRLEQKKIFVLTDAFEVGSKSSACFTTAEVEVGCKGGSGLWRHRHYHNLLLSGIGL